MRVKFEKTGLAVYISHLDLVRLFARSLARAKIETAHSEGFNPRPKIVFAGAIPLGIESLCEFADIKIPGPQIPPNPEKIAGFFPHGINIREIYEPAADFKNISDTKFQIYLKADGFGTAELEDLFSEGFLMEKKNKIKINSKDYIFNIGISENPEGYIIINACIKTSPEAYLSPETLIKAVGAKYTAYDYFIKKIEVYDKNGSVFK